MREAHFSTLHNTLLARLLPRESRRERVKPRSIRHALTLAYLWFSSPWFLWGINRDPVDDKINDVLPRACERSGRGNIFTWKNHLIQRKRGEISLTNLHDHRQLQDGVETRSEQSSALYRLKERLELVNILDLQELGDLGVRLPTLGHLPG